MKIKIGALREIDADNSNLIDFSVARFPGEVASVHYQADFEIIEQEENDERSK